MLKILINININNLKRGINMNIVTLTCEESNASKNIAKMVQELHNKRGNDSFLIDLPNATDVSLGNVLCIFFSTNEILEKIMSDPIIKIDMYDNFHTNIKTYNDFQVNTLLKKGKVAVVKKVSNNSYNKPNIKNYFNKNIETFKKAETFKEFVELMGYNNPKQIHRDIFKHKDLETVEDIANAVNKLKEKRAFLKLFSNSAKSEIRVEIERIVYDSLPENAKLLEFSGERGYGLSNGSELFYVPVI